MKTMMLKIIKMNNTIKEILFYSKEKKKIFLRLSIIALMFLVIIVLSIAYGNYNKKNVKGTSVNSAISRNKIAEISKDKNGNIYMEQNKLFLKYTVTVPSTISDISYKQKDGYLIIIFDQGISLKLNSSIGNINSKDIHLIDDDGKHNLLLKEKYDNNNFVYINDGKESKEVVILISKVKEPITHKAVLNPGHGGMDSGQSVGNLHEKDITLKIVKLMESDLKYNGFEVVLTRNKDEGKALADIADFVNKNKPDVFLSVHINGIDKNPSKYQGIGVYYYDENGFQTAERIKLANIVLKYATKDDGWKNDGVIKDKLKVIRLSKYPCVLVEAGYLTNSIDQARLQNDKVLKNLANNLALALKEYVDEK